MGKDQEVGQECLTAYVATAANAGPQSKLRAIREIVRLIPDVVSRSILRLVSY